VVIVIGSQASGNDISTDIATIAKEVHISSKMVASDSYGCYDNLRIHPTVVKWNIKTT